MLNVSLRRKPLLVVKMDFFCPCFSNPGWKDSVTNPLVDLLDQIHAKISLPSSSKELSATVRNAS